MSKTHAPVTVPANLTLDTATYASRMKLGRFFSSHTGLNVKVFKDDANVVKEGDIFLFNHFTRLETLIPPTVIYNETGAFTRSVAHHALFSVNATMATIMRQGGAVPNNMPGLLPFLVREVLRGRKMVLFPEGGMVKDRRVVDKDGGFSMYSSSAKTHRKAHRGAAVVAIMLDLVKRRIHHAFASRDEHAILAWCNDIGTDRKSLEAAANKPTNIVPANITYYPIRTGANLLARGLGAFMPQAPLQAFDEVIIEGNILLKHTDMDVHFGRAINPRADMTAMERILVDPQLMQLTSVDDLFDMHDNPTGIAARYFATFVDDEAAKLRDTYMRAIYTATTVNMHHLVATLIELMVEQGRMEIPAADFHKALYIAIKGLQHNPNVHLHCSLERPVNYSGILDGEPAGLKSFIKTCANAKLLKLKDGMYRLSNRLRDVMDFEDIRLENPVRVHANEVAPIAAVRATLEAALAEAHNVSDEEIAGYLYDDELKDYAGQRYRFGERAPETLLNGTNDENGRPYFLLPLKKTKVGVLLIHGFSSSPAELRDFGDSLQADGYAVYGVRLPGHGTSYHNLEDHTHADWIASVRTGYRILAAHVDKVVVVGFSTGASVALQALAQGLGPKFAGIASVSAPYEVMDKNMRYLPLVILFRKTLGQLPFLRTALRYYRIGCTTPEMNYFTVPVWGLNELRKLINALPDALRKLGQAEVLVVQGLKDGTVHPSSAQTIYDQIPSETKELRWIADGPHGLIRDNFGPTWKVLKKFIKDVTAGVKRRG